MAGQYVPIAPDPQYGVTEYAPMPPYPQYGHPASPMPQYAPTSPYPQAQYSPQPQYTPQTQYTPVDTPLKKAPRLTARSVSSFFSRSSQQSPKYTTKSRPKSYTWHLIGHVFSLLWMVPIIALLVLNLTNHVIGPSAWCPGGRCPADVWDGNAVARARHLDENDHNALGALQLVAKALEVWFMFVATALIYDLAMILARKEGGLPIGFLLTHLQFTDIRNLFNPYLWTSAIPQRHAPRSQQKSAARLMIFGIFAALLTILANLMGPAAAVLVLPSLKWVDTPRIPKGLFTAMHTDKPPPADLPNTECNETSVAAGEYSCTYLPHASSLDHFASSALMTEVQYMQNFSLRIATTAQESAVQFVVNVTQNDGVIWAANRQVLQDLSLDFFKLGAPQLYGTPATRLNDSLQVLLNRQGPSVGSSAYCNWGNTVVVDVDDQKQIHCFSGWTIDYVHNYTKCFRVGEGFNSANKYTNFWIGTTDPEVPINETAVDAFFSDRALVFDDKTDFGSGIERCLDPDKAPTCDWDKIFSTEMPLSVRNMTENVGVVSYSFYDTDSTSDPKPDDRARIYCDSVSYLGFPTYSLDTLPSTNPISLVKLQGLALIENSDPIVIDPSWFLAAFSVDVNGTVAAKRQIAQVFQKVLAGAWASQADTGDYFWQTLEWLHLYTLIQTMSIVPYEATNLTLPSATAADKKSKDLQKPVLHTWATRHVWAYGIGGSRTSKLGIAVVCTGVLCVLFRLILGLARGKREHSPVELFVAALEHAPTGEFEGLKDPQRMAKVRYVMEEDEDGKPRFVPERQYTGDFGKGRRKTFSWRKNSSNGGGGEAQGLGVGIGESWAESPPVYHAMR